MSRCLELASLGAGWTHPNPLVGCVIVRKGRVVSEGYHRRFGGPHAEVIALGRAGRRANGATLYVNLEPCAHHGKTPPCVDAVLAAGISRVVCASEDPNPLVSGKGFRTLRSKGVKVVSGIMRREARDLNEKFFWYMENRVPFVGVKVAQTLDGKIADYQGHSRWITSDRARAYGHRLRSAYDAILVGAATVRKDDPRLTVRGAKGRNPVRVVVDGEFTVPSGARILTRLESRTLIVTSSRALRRKRSKAIQLEKRGVEVFGIDGGADLRPRYILRVLGELGISSVLIEGGARTIRSFLESGTVNRLHCFIAPKILGMGLTGLQMRPQKLQSAPVLKNQAVTILGTDLLIEGTLR